MITKNGKKIILNERCFYVDATLKKDEPENFCFKSLHQAIHHSQDGTKEVPMTIYLEPNVYQMKGSKEDRGLYINKDWVSLIGLTENPEDVVLADNRGHMIGAEGTNGSSPAETLYVTGTGFYVENLTIGNYCNVDLIYPKDPDKNQLKRSKTITQAYCLGAGNPNKTLDCYVFRNVRLVSMLDTLALGKVKRAYFEGCYIQGTDDFMGGGDMHVMKDTTLHCYSGKPIYKAGKEGMAFINCKWEIDFKELTTLNLTKHSSTLYFIGCSFEDLKGTLNEIRWSSYPESHIKGYSYKTYLNGKPYTIMPEQNGILLDDSQVEAYAVSCFLSGKDRWCPIAAVKNKKGEEPLNLKIPNTLEIHPDSFNKQNRCEVVSYPEYENLPLTWTSNRPDLLNIEGTGQIVKLKGNHSAITKPTQIVLRVLAVNGIYNECQVILYPQLAKAPSFTKLPQVKIEKTGKLLLDYELQGREEKDEEQSVIKWYRYLGKGEDKSILSAVSHDNKTLRDYKLTCGDVGYYIMAVIEPKYSNTKLGSSVVAVTERKISWEDLEGEGLAKYNYETSFEHFPTERLNLLIPGIWTVDSYYPLGQEQVWLPEMQNTWEYGQGIDGAFNSCGLLSIGRGARLLWTQERTFKDMEVYLELNVEKTGGQGFGSATGQYLEVYIKYDTKTLSGYGLRIERTTKYGFATDFTLYEYKNGEGKAVSETISSTAFTSLCKLHLWTEKKKLYLAADSSSKTSLQQKESGLCHALKLAADIDECLWGGIGIQHTGTVSKGNRIQLKKLRVSYSQ